MEMTFVKLRNEKSASGYAPLAIFALFYKMRVLHL